MEIIYTTGKKQNLKGIDTLKQKKNLLYLYEDEGYEFELRYIINMDKVKYIKWD